MFEYSGMLEVYYETGMESLALILHDDRGLTSNPQYDPTKTGFPYDIKNWHSLSYALFFKGGEEIEVYRRDGSIKYRGTLTKDREAMAASKYRFNFLPKEIDKDTWLKWFAENRRAKVWSLKKAMSA